MSLFKCFIILLSVEAKAGISSREYLLDEDIRRFLYNECRVGRNGIPCYHDGGKEQRMNFECMVIHIPRCYKVSSTININTSTILNFLCIFKIVFFTKCVLRNLAKFLPYNLGILLCIKRHTIIFQLHYCCLGPHCSMECDPINSWPEHLSLFRNYETHVPIVMKMAAPLFDSSVQFLKDWPETMVSPATEHLFKEYRRQLMLFHDTILTLIRESAPEYK
uniref:Uncharacterized protein n=1 Tax=Heterorhabditis bacteriophora TaxID=37862 RepID=A0A1I7XM75_HETBA